MQIVVTHSHFQLGSLAALVLKLFGLTKKSFRTSHLQIEWNKGRFSWFLYPIFIRCLFPIFFDGEIGVSEAIYHYLRGRKISARFFEKIHLIPNGINVDEIIEKSKLTIQEIPSRNFPENSFIIGSVGRLTDQKGFLYIIQAMPIIIQEIPNCKLLIVGDGELKQHLKRLVSSLGLDDFIYFLGLRDDVPALLMEWDVFVLSSLWEGFPTVVMEAMACNVPVIATNIPGTRELVAHEATGLLVEPQDIDGLAKAVIRLYHDEPLREKISKNAKYKVNMFDMKMIKDQYARLYQQSLETRQSDYEKC